MGEAQLRVGSRDRFKRKSRRHCDPVFGDVEWIVTGRYNVITMRGSVECVRMRAVVSNTFSIHVTVDYLEKNFIKIPEKCYSWRDSRRCLKQPNHAGAHKYGRRPIGGGVKEE